MHLYNKGEIDAAKKQLQKEYDITKSDETLVALLNLRNNSNDLKKDNYFQIALQSKNHYLLALTGSILFQSGEIKEAYNNILRSLLIDDKDKGLVKYLYNVASKVTSNSDYAANIEKVCVLRDEKNTINIAIHPKNFLNGISPNGFANCRHYDFEDVSISNLLYSNIGDTIVFDDKVFTILEIETIPNYMSRYSLKAILESDDVIAFRGDTPEEAVKEITDFLKKSNEEMADILKNYNNMDIKPSIMMFSGYMGKSVLETCQFLIYENKARITNNANHIKLEDNNTLILTYESIMNLIFTDLEEKIFKTYNCIISPYVYRKIINEIDKEITELQDPRQRGSIAYKDNHLNMYEYDNKSKTIRHKFLIRIKNFVNKIPQCEEYDTNYENSYIRDLLVKEKLYCDKSSIELTRGVSNGILLTDDQFVYSIANTEGIKSIGLYSLLVNLAESLSEHVEHAQKLDSINFMFYFGIDAYLKCTDILKSNPESELENSKMLSSFLVSVDSDTEPSKHHRKLIVELYRSVFSRFGEVSFNDPLHRIAMQHFCVLNPDFIKNAVKDAMQEFSLSNCQFVDKEGNETK